MLKVDWGSVQVVTVTGTSGDDTITGTPGGEVLVGGDGDDLLIDDDGGQLNGGDGNDTLVAGQSGYIGMYGGDGDDVYKVTSPYHPGTITIGDHFSGTDTIDLTGFVDDLAHLEIYSKNGKSYFCALDNWGNRIKEIEVRDQSYSSTDYISIEILKIGNKTYDISSSAALDALWQSAGTQSLADSREQSTITGTDRNETLSGTNQDDLIQGGGGNDRIVAGGLGNDTLVGGEGSNTFVVSAASGEDYRYQNVWIKADGHTNDGDTLDIRNWVPSTDHIRFETDSQNPSVLLIHAVDVRGIIISTITITDQFTDGMGIESIRLPGGQTINIDGVTLAKEMQALAEGQSTQGNDVIHGGADNNGKDTIYGSGGDDTIYGDDGNDRIYGGNGEDLIHGGDGDDNMDAGAGNDLLMGDAGNDTLYGGDGNDTLIVDAGVYGDHIGGDGNDLFIAQQGSASITEPVSGVYGGDGLDTLDLSAVVDSIDDLRVTRGSLNRQFRIYYELEDGTIQCIAVREIEVVRIDDQIWQIPEDGWAAYSVLIEGASDEDDIFTATANEDLLYGLDGNDTIYGGDGDARDIIYGGEGDDHLYGQGGTDPLYGGLGDDQLFGEDGDDYLYGEDGNDTLRGGNGDDSIDGGMGDDVLYGGPGDDLLFGNRGTNTVYTGAIGDDTIRSTSLSYNHVIVERGDLVAHQGTIQMSVSNRLDLTDAVANISQIKFEATGTDDDYRIIFNDANGTEMGGVNIDFTSSDFYGFRIQFGNQVFVVSGLTVAEVQNLFDTYSPSNRLEFIGTDAAERIRSTKDNEYILAGDGNDTLTALAGNDTLEGGKGADILDGGDGIDLASYAESDERVFIDLSAEWTAGGDAYGDVYIDIEGVIGSRFDDELWGSDTANKLIGGDGDDILDGLGGRDILTGGSGADIFRFRGTWGQDTVTDFRQAQGDILDLSETNLAYSDLTISQSGANTVIITTGGDQITLRGIDASTINETAFRFIEGDGSLYDTPPVRSDAVSYDDAAGVIAGYYYQNDTTGDLVLTYSFPGEDGFYAGSSYGYEGTEPYEALRGLSNASQDLFRDILATITPFTNLSFKETEDSGSTAGVIRVAWSDAFDNEYISAWAYYPNELSLGSDIWLNSASMSASDSDFGLVLIHELGHALGLEHSFEEGTVAQRHEGNNYTVMSYTLSTHYRDAVSADLHPQTFMALDIKALQHLYGVDTVTTAGNDTYVFDVSESYYLTIWDYSGTDTIAITGTGKNVTLDLRPGSWSRIGSVITYTFADNSTETEGRTLYITDDTIIERAFGGDGDDNIFGNDVDNVLRGGDGDDVLIGYAGDDALWAGADDTGDDTFYGETGNDTLGGGDGDDSLYGGLGSDIIFGGQGNDLIHAVNTWEQSSDETNQIWSGQGADTIHGSDGGDVIGGGLGDDLVNAAAGDDLVYAGKTGRDTLEGGDGNDTLYGGTENDLIKGQAGHDLLFGGAGDDVIEGGVGNDNLFNGSGDDTVSGSAGSDSLWGGAGNDILSGGPGPDTFAFSETSGHDKVTDFELDSDILILSAAGIIDFAAAASETEEGLLITLSDASSVLLEGLTLEDLDQISVLI